MSVPCREGHQEEGTSGRKADQGQAKGGPFRTRQPSGKKSPRCAAPRSMCISINLPKPSDSRCAKTVAKYLHPRTADARSCHSHQAGPGRLHRQDLEKSLDQFADNYEAYFKKHTDGNLTMLDPGTALGNLAGARNPELRCKRKRRPASSPTSSVTPGRPSPPSRTPSAGGKHCLPARFLISNTGNSNRPSLKKAGGQRSAFTRGKSRLVTGSAAGIGFACAQPRSPSREPRS